ncbi:MAG: ABC transporter ATP-binding protein [Actinomycetota bacterium]|nr:ABC transporter ATP-binding protein [Actinomycetota bacterium]
MRVSFGRTHALKGLTLQLGPGIVGLFGQNGSGKSTLLRALAGLLQPTAGTVSLDGVGWGRSTAETLRSQIGYAGHDCGLYGQLTVRENLTLAATLYGAPAERVDVVERALEIEASSGIRARHLSAGLKRKVAVARALVHEPRFLFLDEPYANLDDEGAERLSAALQEWRAGGDRLGIVATHGAKRVKGFADASVILQRGELVSHRVRSDIEAFV